MEMATSPITYFVHGSQFSTVEEVHWDLASTMLTKSLICLVVMGSRRLYMGLTIILIQKPLKIMFLQAYSMSQQTSIFYIEMIIMYSFDSFI